MFVTKSYFCINISNPDERNTHFIMDWVGESNGIFKSKGWGVGWGVGVGDGKELGIQSGTKVNTNFKTRSKY